MASVFVPGSKPHIKLNVSKFRSGVEKLCITVSAMCTDMDMGSYGVTQNKVGFCVLGLIESLSRLGHDPVVRELLC